jgi:hypothetical protein
VQDLRSHLREVKGDIDGLTNKGAGGAAIGAAIGAASGAGGAARAGAGKKDAQTVDTLVVFSLCPPGVALRASLFVRRWLLVQVGGEIIEWRCRWVVKLCGESIEWRCRWVMKV